MNPLRQSKKIWYQNNKSVFIKTSRPISTEEIYQIKITRAESIQKMLLDSSLHTLYFRYNKNYFDNQKFKITPLNFKWKATNVSLKGPLLFESSQYISDSLKAVLPKKIQLKLDTLKQTFKLKKIDHFHFSLHLLTLSNLSEDTVNISPNHNKLNIYFTHDSTDNLAGFVYIETPQTTGFVKIPLITKLPISKPSSQWKFLLYKQKNKENIIFPAFDNELKSIPHLIGPLEQGKYQLSLFIDVNRNNTLDIGNIEPWVEQEPFFEIEKEFTIKILDTTKVKIEF